MIYRLCFPSGAELSVRTADPTLGELLDEAFRPGLVCELAGQTIVLEEAKRESLNLTGSVFNIRTDSPLCVHTALPNGRTRSVNPLEEDFSRLINENYRRKWSIVTGVDPEDDITLTARSVGMQDKCVTNIKGIWVTGWSGSYRLTGTSKALEFLYHTGQGSRNSMGFGLFDIV